MGGNSGLKCAASNIVYYLRRKRKDIKVLSEMSVFKL